MYNKTMDLTKKTYDQVEATCVKVDEITIENVTFYTPIYEYEIDNKKYSTEGKLKISYRAHSNYPKKGEKRELWIDSNNPEVVRILEPSQYNSLQFDYGAETPLIKKLRKNCTAETNGKITNVLYIGNDIYAPVANYAVRAKYKVDGKTIESNAFVVAVDDTEIFEKEIKILYNPSKPHEFFAKEYIANDAYGFTLKF